MKTSLGRTVLLVKDYDEAFAFYQKNFFCKKLYDETAPGGQRFLHIGFSEEDSMGIWFLQSDSDDQHAAVGNQTAGQPTLVIYTDNCEKLFTHVKNNGVTILENLTATPESKFFHCKDLYGNRLTVVELTAKN